VPGDGHDGQDDETWADHTDVRPTMLSLLGLEDRYLHDGRVLIEQLHGWAVPRSLRTHRETLRRLGEVYKQLNAPFGSFGMNTLAASTRAIKSGSDADDSTYTTLTAQIESLTAERDGVAAQMRAMLGRAAFEDQAINERQAMRLIAQGERLLAQAKGLNP